MAFSSQAFVSISHRSTTPWRWREHGMQKKWWKEHGMTKKSYIAFPYRSLFQTLLLFPVTILPKQTFIILSFLKLHSLGWLLTHQISFPYIVLILNLHPLLLMEFSRRSSNHPLCPLSIALALLPLITTISNKPLSNWASKHAFIIFTLTSLHLLWSTTPLSHSHIHARKFHTKMTWIVSLIFTSIAAAYSQQMHLRPPWRGWPVNATRNLRPGDAQTPTSSILVLIDITERARSWSSTIQACHGHGTSPIVCCLWSQGTFLWRIWEGGWLPKPWINMDASFFRRRLKRAGRRTLIRFFLSWKIIYVT